jgi:hypothetical protein
LPAVRALGYNFTATTEVLFDGTAVATTFVSVSELTFPINPVPETVQRTAVITVRDGATVGVGAVPFAFSIVTTTDHRIGLDDTTTPGVVDLQVANLNGEIGGVTVVPRSDVQGLELDLVTGALTAPLATPLLAGSLIEPPDDSKGYVRQTTGASSTWVPPADTPTPDYGIGLTEDTTATPTVVNLDIANTNGEIGGVMTEPRTNIQGLDMAATGLITVPLATPLLAGALTEPPDDSKGYVRQTTGASSTWVPPATTPLPDYGIGIDLDATTPPGTVNLLPAKFDPLNLGGVYILPATGIGITTDGGLAGIRATPSVQGMLRDAPYDAKNYARKDGAWIEATTPLPTDLPIAGNIEAKRGVVWVPDDRGLNVDSTGQLWLRPATSQQYGGLTLPTDPTGTKTFMRRVSDWVEAPVADLKPAGDTKAEIGVVFVPARTNMQALTLNVDGQLTCLLATPGLAGAILEPPADDKGYVRQTSSKGGSSWVPPALPPGVYTDDAPPAVPTEDQLWFDTDSGELLIYINDGTSSQWVQMTGGGGSGVIIADDPPATPAAGTQWFESDTGRMFLWFDDGTSAQWVQVGGR